MRQNIAKYSLYIYFPIKYYIFGYLKPYRCSMLEANYFTTRSNSRVPKSEDGNADKVTMQKSSANSFSWHEKLLR